MEKQHLREQLASLHVALANAGEVGPEARELLAEVLDDIQRLLEAEERERRPEGVVERLREAVEEFEESHPTLSEAAGRVIDALARMGI